MLSRGRLRLVVALALIMPVLLYWGLSGSTLPQRTQLVPNNQESIDFFMREARTTYWDQQGRLDYQWQTPELFHYPKRGISSLLTPRALMPGANGDQYNIQANQGEVRDDQALIALAGDVEVHHNPQSGIPSMLTTDALTVIPPQALARTDDLATVTRGREQMESVGLEVYFDERRIEMLSNVKGRYAAP
jgi:lipopolysaccharide export system protein LptC